MLLLSLSSFNTMVLSTKWHSLLEKVNSSFHKPILVFPMDRLRSFLLCQLQFQVKLRTGQELMLELKFKASIQLITKLFLIMEENTLIKPLYLPQVLTKQAHTLKVYQKWKTLTSLKMFLFMLLMLRKESLETGTTDGTIQMVI